MTIIRKTLQYNHGTPLPFEVIKQNREKAIVEMAEGNPGLYKLLNTCIDMDLPTLSSCGDVAPMIAFDYNDKTKELLCSLWAYLESLYQEGIINCSINLSHSYLANRSLIVLIREKDESSRIFHLINQFVKNPEYLSDYTFYEQIDAILEALSKVYTAVHIGDGHHEHKEYKYIMYLSNKKNILQPLPKGLKTDVDYIEGYGLVNGYHFYGIRNEQEIESLMYSLYDGIHEKTKEYPMLENLVYKLEKNKK